MRKKKKEGSLRGIRVSSSNEIYKNKNYSCACTQKNYHKIFITIEVSNLSYVKRKLNILIKYYTRIDHNLKQRVL